MAALAARLFAESRRKLQRSGALVIWDLREAYHREYFCLLIEDATHHAGPAYLREATLWNVERFFGWVAPVAGLEAACDD